MGSWHWHTETKRCVPAAQGHIQSANIYFAAMGSGSVGDFSPIFSQAFKMVILWYSKMFKILDLLSLCEKGLKDISEHLTADGS